MTDELDKQIADFLQRWTDWTGQEDYDQAKQAIQALIDQERTKARIDELNTAEAWAYGMAELAKERIAELSNKENTNEQNR